MGKTAFLFPGQGSQYIGMAKDFYENEEASRKIFDIADESLDIKISDLVFEENDKINITEYTQAAMLTAEVAILKAIEERGIKSDINAGLSLGEYAAVVASGVMSFSDAVKVVRKRGIYMQEEVPQGVGAMAAVLGLDSETILEVLNNIEGTVEIANYNCPGQIVISGEAGAVEEAGKQLKEKGAKRVLALNVSGPFHTSMLKGAGEKLMTVLNEVQINEVSVPYYSNVTAEEVTDSKDVKELLKRQVSSSVKFEQTIRNMIENGTDTFIEIGPGRTLSSFVKKVNRDVKVINIDKYEDMQKLDELMEVVQ